MLSVQSLQLWEISPTSSILILCPTAFGDGSPFCPGCFAFGSMFDPLRPLSRDLPRSMCSPSIGPSTCVFANLMFKIGRLSLRSRCEICDEERDRSEDTRDMDRELSLWPLVCSLRRLADLGLCRNSIHCLGRGRKGGMGRFGC
jgi:hypothetical protein